MQSSVFRKEKQLFLSFDSIFKSNDAQKMSSAILIPFLNINNQYSEKIIDYSCRNVGEVVEECL